jgi:2,3-bisphosphoglycerate-dependent phosphoglycerate mutase
MMVQLILLRHGQSQWNLENRFTGWVDVDLTPDGEAQARQGGELIREKGIAIDMAFTSVLMRAIRTCNLALDTSGQSFVPVTKDWRLNERHYGGLTGLDKAETAARHGDEMVKIWRRSYDVPPPPIEGDPYGFMSDRRYKGADIPTTESLKSTLERVLPSWNGVLKPALMSGQTLLVAAHGNSIRAIVKQLFNLNEAEIIEIEIPTGNPLVIELDAALSPKAAAYLNSERANPLPKVA